ncbi:4-hydroxyphenylacetate 3-hydroxylase family protein [Nocardia sp. NPDC003963]
MTRSGKEYIERLDDGRRVMVNGEVVRDVPAHPAFAGAVGSIARHYDHAHAPENRDVMTFTSPATGEPVNRSFLIPRSAADLAARGAALRRSAELSVGMLGRNPDHVAAFFAGWAGRRDVFARANESYADNLVRFYEHLRDEDLYAVYAIVPPQIDRSKPAHQQADPHLYAGVTGETDGGIRVSGAQMLATGAALADYIVLSNIAPQRPGDEDQAINVAIPVGASGVKIYSRRPYATGATSVFDYPLSTRFDETDALVVLDDVFVPWEHVFVLRDREICAAQWTETPAHVLGNHQAQVRLATKLDFAVGLAHRIAEATGNLAAPPVRGALGEMAAHAGIVSGLLAAQERNCEIDDEGIAWPGREECFAVMTLQSELYPKVMHMLRDLCGGGLIQLPSAAADFAHPEMQADLERYIGGPDETAEERVKLLKLAWDLVGSEFGGRHHQYEMFYVGAPFVVRQRMYGVYDFDRRRSLVDTVLAGYDLDTPLPGGAR